MTVKGEGGPFAAIDLFYVKCKIRGPGNIRKSQYVIDEDRILGFIRAVSDVLGVEISTESGLDYSVETVAALPLTVSRSSISPSASSLGKTLDEILIRVSRIGPFICLEHYRWEVIRNEDGYITWRGVLHCGPSGIESEFSDVFSVVMKCAILADFQILDEALLRKVVPGTSLDLADRTGTVYELLFTEI